MVPKTETLCDTNSYRSVPAFVKRILLKNITPSMNHDDINLLIWLFVKLPLNTKVPLRQPARFGEAWELLEEHQSPRRVL